jgi:hypothetical protein
LKPEQAWEIRQPELRGPHVGRSAPKAIHGLSKSRPVLRTVLFSEVACNVVGAGGIWKPPRCEKIRKCALMAGMAAHGILKPEQSGDIGQPESRGSYVGRSARFAFHKQSAFQFQEDSMPLGGGSAAQRQNPLI